MPGDLDAQLRVFHDAITGAAPLASARALVRDDGVDPIARLAVYAHAYVSRIAGVLGREYPKLRAVAGAERFDALVEPYLRAHPTRSPSLREAGAHLARFLSARATAADTATATAGDAAAASDTVQGWADLARLERARVEAFDGPDARPLTRDEVAARDPADFPSLQVVLVPTAALVELATNADDVWDAVEDGRAPPASVTAPRTVVVWRRDITVIHRTLEADEAPALRCVAAGGSFGDVCEAVAGPPERAPDWAAQLLVRWLDAELLAGT